MKQRVSESGGPLQRYFLFSLFNVFIFCHEVPGIFVYFLEASSDLCRQNTESVVSKLPPLIRASHPTPLVTMCCRYCFVAKTSGSNPCRVAARVAPTLCFLHEIQVNGTQNLSHVKIINYCQQKSNDCDENRSKI